eukprot:scaffold20032_cov96-Isochrysis_galbana.AAC.4
MAMRTCPHAWGSACPMTSRVGVAAAGWAAHHAAHFVLHEGGRLDAHEVRHAQRARRVPAGQRERVCCWCACVRGGLGLASKVGRSEGLAAGRCTSHPSV